MRLKKSYIIVLTWFLLAACQPSTTSSDGVGSKLALAADESVEYGQLPNGLRYAVMANSTPSNTASLLMRFGAGSIDEADETRGIAHFLEHMAFNGSDNIPEGEMIKRLEVFGLAFGADTNASTSFDETIYKLELPEVNEEIIDETLMIMRETASNLTLDPAAIDRERGVILAEKRARVSPAYKSSINSLKFLLQGSLFVDRIPIGTEESISSVTPEQFKAFYRGHYRPEDTFIVLVGDFETDYAASKIESFFADWSGQGTALADYDIPALGARGLEAEYYVDPEIQTSISLNVMSAPDLRKDTAENRKTAFIEGLGNRILSRRLARLARSGEAAFISASASSSNVYDVRNISSLSMSAQPQSWAAALAQGEQTLRQAYEFGFTQAELDEQIANTRKALQVAVQTSPTRRTSALARRIMSSFSNERVMTAPADNLEHFEAYASDITPEAVHKAFKAGWKGLETPQLYLSTSEVIDNPEEAMLKALAESRAVAVSPLESAKSAEFAYTEFGAPGAIASRKTIDDIEFETIIFDNNVRLNLKKTPYQKDVISIKAAIGQGTLFFPESEEGFKWFAPNMLNLSGLKAHSADEIQTIMAGKSVNVSLSFGPERMYMSGSTVPENLADQLNLMAAYAVAPGYRKEAKTRYDKYIESFYPTLDSTPGGVASRDVDRLIRSGDKRFGIPNQQALIDIDMKTLENWLEPRLEASAIEIGIVGDFETDVVIEQVARTFGALPRRALQPVTPAPASTALSFPQGSPRPVKLSHAGEADTALLRVYWPAPDGRDVKTARHMGMLAELFQLRLTEVMREEEGASYSPSAFNFSPRTYPDYGYMGASIELSPKDADRISQRVDAIAAEFKAGEFDEALFSRAITPARERIETSLENNSYWLNVIGRAQTDPERTERHRSRHQMYQNMTVDDLKPLAAQIFDPDKAYRVQILPMK